MIIRQNLISAFEVKGSLEKKSEVTTHPASERRQQGKKEEKTRRHCSQPVFRRNTLNHFSSTTSPLVFHFSSFQKGDDDPFLVRKWRSKARCAKETLPIATFTGWRQVPKAPETTCHRKIPKTPAITYRNFIANRRHPHH